jgi:uncharacterized protein YqeY
MKERIQSRIKECMKEKNTFELNILKTVLGEIQTIEIRSGELKSEEIESILRKFKQGVVESLVRQYKTDLDNDAVKSLVSKLANASVEEIGEATSKSEDANDFFNEIKIYESYIPKTLSVDEIADILDGIESIKIMENEGQMMGVAMKYFKSSDLKVLGKDVKEAIKKIRK